MGKTNGARNGVADELTTSICITTDLHDGDATVKREGSGYRTDWTGHMHRSSLFGAVRSGYMNEESLFWSRTYLTFGDDSLRALISRIRKLEGTM